MNKEKILFPFSTAKGNTTLKCILSKVGGEYNAMGLLKLIFFADRYHIRKYARPVSYDEYFALKLGPVPSNIKDILSVADFCEDIVPINKHDVKLANTNVGTGELSKSDIEAIDFSVKHFGQIGKGYKQSFKLAEITHGYPEWDKYRERFSKEPYGREEMDYLDFLKNADPKHPDFVKNNFTDPFPVLSDEVAAELKEEILDRFLVSD